MKKLFAGALLLFIVSCNNNQVLEVQKEFKSDLSRELGVITSVGFRYLPTTNQIKLLRFDSYDGATRYTITYTQIENGVEESKIINRDATNQDRIHIPVKSSATVKLIEAFDINNILIAKYEEVDDTGGEGDFEPGKITGARLEEFKPGAKCKYLRFNNYPGAQKYFIKTYYYYNREVKRRDITLIATDEDPSVLVHENSSYYIEAIRNGEVIATN